MNIIFYKLQDKANDVKKIKTLTATQTYIPLTISGTLRSMSSKINPIIEFGKNITYFNDYNYAYIADFNRYYFINEMIAVRADITSITFKVDVLTSFLTQSNTNNLIGYVVRCNNSAYYDINVEDLEVQIESIPVITETDTSSLRPSTNYIDTTFTTGYGAYHFYNCIMDVVGYSSGGAGTMLSNITIPSYLTTLYNEAVINVNSFYPYDAERLYLMDINELGKVSEKAVPDPDHFNDYVKSVTLYPFEIKDISNTTSYPRNNICYGNNKELSGATACILPSGYKSILTVDDFVVSKNNNYIGYQLNDKHNKIEYYIPYYGWLKLDTNSVYGHRLILYYIPNYRTGISIVNLYDYTSGKYIFSSTCQLGFKFAFSKTNAWEVAQRQGTYNTNLVLSTLTSVGIGIVGAVTENPYMVMAGISGVASSYGSWVSKTVTNFEKATANIGDDSISSLTPQKPRIRWTTDVFTQVSNSDIFKYHNGICTNKLLKIGDLRITNANVFAKIIDLDIEDDSSYITDITYTEMQELKNLCAEGIYL